MFGLITLTLVINYALLGWAKKLKSSKCWWGQTSHACSFQDMWKWKSATKSWLRPRLRNEQERFWRHLTTAVKQKHVSGHFIACASWNNLTSYLLDEKKKLLRVLQILFTLVSCHMSFQYAIICAVLISQTQVLSTLLLHMEYTWLTPQAGKMSLSCPLGSTCFVLQEKTLF